MTDRERWQELDQQATPGPWAVEESGSWVYASGYELADIYGDNTVATAGFIATARTAWPAAERECEQLRNLLRQVKEEVNQGWYGDGLAYESVLEVRRLIDESGLFADEGQQQ